MKKREKTDFLKKKCSIRPSCSLSPLLRNDLRRSPEAIPPNVSLQYISSKHNAQWNRCAAANTPQKAIQIAFLKGFFKGSSKARATPDHAPRNAELHLKENIFAVGRLAGQSPGRR